MRFFPALTEEFTSPLPPPELLRRLRDDMQTGRAFTGTAGPTGFTISRVIDYRNSMLPRIEGWVVAGAAGGSRLRLQHRLTTFTLVFGVVWLLVVGSVVLGMLPLLAEVVRAGRWREISGPDFIPVGMLLFGILLLTVPFWLEVRQSRPRLIELLHLQAVPLAAPTGH